MFNRICQGMCESKSRSQVIVLKEDDRIDDFSYTLGKGFRYNCRENLFYCAECRYKNLRYCGSFEDGYDQFVISWECDKCAVCERVIFNCHEYNNHCRNWRRQAWNVTRVRVRFVEGVQDGMVRICSAICVRRVIIGIVRTAHCSVRSIAVIVDCAKIKIRRNSEMTNKKLLYWLQII